MPQSQFFASATLAQALRVWVGAALAALLTLTASMAWGQLVIFVTEFEGQGANLRLQVEWVGGQAGDAVSLVANRTSYEFPTLNLYPDDEVTPWGTMAGANANAEPHLIREEYTGPNETQVSLAAVNSGSGVPELDTGDSKKVLGMAAVRFIPFPPVNGDLIYYYSSTQTARFLLPTPVFASAEMAARYTVGNYQCSYESRREGGLSVRQVTPGQVYTMPHTPWTQTFKAKDVVRSFENLEFTGDGLITCTIRLTAKTVAVTNPTVQVRKTSFGGAGSFGFAYTGLSSSAETLTTPGSGSAYGVSGAVHTGTAGTAASVSEVSGMGGYTTRYTCSDAAGVGGSALSGNGTSVTIPATGMVSGAAWVCAFNNIKNGSTEEPTTPTTTPTPPPVIKLELGKAAKRSTVNGVGDMIPFQLVINNTSGYSANNFTVIDTAAAGLSAVASSVRVKGDSSYTVTSYQPLTITGLDLAAGGTLTIDYMMGVGAAAARAQTLQNCAKVSHPSGLVSSDSSCASVQRRIDPDMEAALIVGTVFDDKNGNGVQDPEVKDSQGNITQAAEAGIPSARVMTATGQIIHTDAFGRYHVKGIDPGVYSRGRNYIVKLDMNSLPERTENTTQNPLVKRITWGLPTQFNFGVQPLHVAIPLYSAAKQADKPLVQPVVAQPAQPQTVAVAFGADGLFKFDQYRPEDILEPGKSDLAHFAKRLQSDFSQIDRIEIRAHTDRLGSTAYNDKLSQQRAQTVQSYLEQQGVKAAQVQAIGMSEAEPVKACKGQVATPALIECLQPNRRFEIKVTGWSVKPAPAVQK